MSFWNPKADGELKFLTQSLEDAKKIETFRTFLAFQGFSSCLDYSKLYDFDKEYKFHKREYNKHEDREPNCRTTIYCLTYSYYKSEKFKKEFNGGFIVLFDKLNFKEPRNSEGVFKFYLHEHDGYSGYESKRFISKIQTYLYNKLQAS